MVNRREFVQLTVIFGGATATGGAAALLAACSSDVAQPNPTPGGGNDASTGAKDSGGAGADGGDSGKPSGDGGGTFDCRSTISQNHNHSITIPTADLSSSTSKTYSIKGTSPHDHTITLDAKQLAELKVGVSVKTTSTTSDTHGHDVTLLCTTI